ncbi:hypothetical protein BOX15_Mlig008981g1 [Macrostomum lignano]|uniref:Uncharacterized protein n=1 Tax=Macrostomum lignano TaxID=282301 RepID=A0A267EYJ6_9PLAT|nr:hypothetical protein BOX15_Mlig008981g2 [Macrostomum lignano]PAA69306.1 hypothetical protein BOX15_Mlig008981g1 [Macrostomum lignano]
MSVLRRSYSSINLYRLNSATNSLRLEQPAQSSRRQSSAGDSGAGGGAGSGSGDNRTGGSVATGALVLLALAGVTLSSFSAGQLMQSCRSGAGKNDRW